jgi:plastocyanin
LTVANNQNTLKLMKKLLVLIVLLALAGGGFYYYYSKTNAGGNTSPSVTISEELPSDDIVGTVVEIEGFAFKPATVTIKKGETVSWVNRDLVGHSATSDDNKWDTAVFEKDQVRSITFDTAGTFPYHCTPHPNMKATVIVTE